MTLKNKILLAISFLLLITFSLVLIGNAYYIKHNSNKVVAESHISSVSSQISSINGLIDEAINLSAFIHEETLQDFTDYISSSTQSLSSYYSLNKKSLQLLPLSQGIKGYLLLNPDGIYKTDGIIFDYQEVELLKKRLFSKAEVYDEKTNVLFSYEELTGEVPAAQQQSSLFLLSKMNGYPLLILEMDLSSLSSQELPLTLKTDERGKKILYAAPNGTPLPRLSDSHLDILTYESQVTPKHVTHISPLSDSITYIRRIPRQGTAIWRFPLLLCVFILITMFFITLKTSKKFLKPLHSILEQFKGFDSRNQSFLSTQVSLMKKGKKGFDISFRSRLFIYFLLHTLLPSLIYTIIITIFINLSLTTEIQNNLKYSLNERAVQVDSTLAKANQFIDNLAIHASVQELSFNATAQEVDTPHLKQDISEYIYKNQAVQEGEYQLILINDAGKILYQSNPISKVAELFLLNAIDTSFDGDVINRLWSGPLVNPFNKVLTIRNIHNIIPLSSDIQHSDQYDYFGKNAYIVLLLNEKRIFSRSIRDDNLLGQISLHDSKGKMISSFLGSSTLSLHDKDTWEFITFDLPLSGSDWKLTTTVNLSSVLDSSYYLINIIVLILIIIINFSLAYILAFDFTQLLSGLSRVIRGADSYETLIPFFPQEKRNSRDEISTLISSYNQMIDGLRNMIERVYIAEERERKAELYALQSQINPHFLYNTFSSINFLIKMNEREKASLMITTLGELFKWKTSHSPQISIEEELNHVKAYVELQKMRYQDKIDFQYQISESALTGTIVKFTLQPLIENAIYHGMELSTDKGMITLSVKREGDRILILVEDNGVGINTKRLKEIREQLEKPDSNHQIGLYNVKERLMLFFENHIEFTIRSKEGEGTSIRITVPFLNYN